MFEFLQRWEDLRRDGTILDAVQGFLREEDMSPLRDVEAGMLSGTMRLDELEVVFRVSVQETVIVCSCVLPNAVPDERQDQVLRYLARASTLQQFACMSMLRDGHAFVRTALDTDGIPLTRRSLNNLVCACQLLAARFLPYADKVARGELDAAEAAEAAEADWRSFVAQAAAPAPT